jgi:hypothetical protein
MVVTETIAERLCRTRSRTARYLLLDEAALFGAQAVVCILLEGKLTLAEENDKLMHKDTETYDTRATYHR